MTAPQNDLTTAFNSLVSAFNDRTKATEQHAYCVSNLANSVRRLETTTDAASETTKTFLKTFCDLTGSKPLEIAVELAMLDASPERATLFKTFWGGDAEGSNDE